MIVKHELQIFCNNIKLLRKINGLTQKEMSKALGVGVESLRRLECGEIPPRLSCEVLLNIHRIFGIPPYLQFCPLKNNSSIDLTAPRGYNKGEIFNLFR